MSDKRIMRPVPENKMKNFTPGCQKTDSRGSDRFNQLLEGYKARATETLLLGLDTYGMRRDVFAQIIQSFRQSAFALPAQAACCPGCAYCCHLRVGVSIPEVLVIFNELKVKCSHKEWDVLMQRIIRTAQKGDTLSDAWWQESRTACPFLAVDGQHRCSIYTLRPMSCRAYHSTDMTVCEKGFHLGREVQIPCFPLYRASIDMYTAVLIKGMAGKGLFSYQVGFIRALMILLEDDMAVDKWIAGEDVFKTAGLF